MQVFDNLVGLFSCDEPDESQGILSIHAVEKLGYISEINTYTCNYDI